MKKEKQLKYEIIIGLKDKDTYEQMLPTEKFVDIVSTICENNNIGFSMHIMNGGYIHQNGDYILEKSLNISLCYINKKQVMKIAKELRKVFNQESVLVLKQKTDSYIVEEKPKVKKKGKR